MDSIPTETCPQCEAERISFVPGSVNDHCPTCGYKEGCCNVYEAVFEKDRKTENGSDLK